MKCEKCGKDFSPTRKTQKFCSRSCYSRAKANRRYERDKENGKFKSTCPVCGKEFNGTRRNQFFCSVKCVGISNKKYLNIPDCLENADRKIDKNIGYVRVYAPMHKEANSWGYVYEHRLIAEQKIGRALKENEVVHHVNGVRWDNREDNLQVMDRIEHSKLKK